jgi:hypothetical protein
MSDDAVESFDEPTSESYYILDGQQRLTSIARVFLDAHPKRNYYFDLRQMHQKFQDENPSWIVSRARGKKNPDRKDHNRLIRTDVAIDQEKCDVYISEYLEDSDDFPEFKDDRFEARKAAARLKGIFETIRKFSIPFVALENDAPLESVCRVFETINSTGTRLTTFDLAVARYYPAPDLKDLFETSMDKFPVIGEYDIDGERILQILSLYHLRKVDKFPEATRSVLLSLKSDYICDTWDKAADYLSQTCEWLRNLGATERTQPPHGILVSIATTLMCFPDCLRNPNFSATLRRWYFSTTLARSPFPANNYKVGDDFRRFCRNLETGEDLRYPIVYFSTKEIIEVRRAIDGRYKAIQALMRTTVKEDLMTGDRLQGDLEDHHIFPYSLNKSGLSKGLLNSIANRVLVSKRTNRDLTNKNPESYLGDLAELHVAQGSTGDLDRRLKSCFIPYSSSEAGFRDNFAQRRFPEFLSQRAKVLVRRIREVVGDSWKEPSDLDEDFDEDQTVT